MSLVTNLVFVLPFGPEQAKWQRLFEAHFLSASAYEAEPAKCMGSKVSSAVVYHIGANYLPRDFVDNVLNEDWPDGTVLWLHREQEDAPDVTVWPAGIRAKWMQGMAVPGMATP